MRRKILSTILILLLLLSMTQLALAERPIRVLVGGERLKTDVDPIIIQDRTMLPVRAVFESIGAQVDYIEETRTVVAQKGDTTVTFVIDRNIMTINGQEKEIDVPAMIVNNRTLVPVRACAEAFELKVDWDQDTRTAKIRIPVSLIEKDHMSYLYTYDEDGKLLLKEYARANGTKDYVKYTYDAYGNLIFSEDEKGAWAKYTYDEKDNLIYTEGSNGAWEKWEYDQQGNVIFHANLNGQWRSEYDANGNEIYRESGNGSWVKYTYNNAGRKILEEHSSGSWTKYTYDANNHLVCEEDSEGKVIKHSCTLDKNGNVVYHEYGEEDGIKHWSKSTYDEQGNLISSESAVGTTYYEYDENGNLIKETNDSIYGADTTTLYTVMEI